MSEPSRRHVLKATLVFSSGAVASMLRPNGNAHAVLGPACSASAGSCGTTDVAGPAEAFRDAYLAKDWDAIQGMMSSDVSVRVIVGGKHRKKRSPVKARRLLELLFNDCTTTGCSPINTMPCDPEEGCIPIGDPLRLSVLTQECQAPNGFTQLAAIAAKFVGDELFELSVAVVSI